MQKNKTYANGQKVFEQKKNILTYYYKDGTVKAKGKLTKGKMQGKWLFYRQTGALWVIGNLKDNRKHGNWKRYNRKGKVEYDNDFVNGKMVKKDKLRKTK